MLRGSRPAFRRGLNHYDMEKDFFLHYTGNQSGLESVSAESIHKIKEGSSGDLGICRGY